MNYSNWSIKFDMIILEANYEVENYLQIQSIDKQFNIQFALNMNHKNSS